MPWRTDLRLASCFACHWLGDDDIEPKRRAILYDNPREFLGNYLTFPIERKDYDCACACLKGDRKFILPVAIGH